MLAHTEQQLRREPAGWYVGFANCRDEFVKDLLRQMYTRPAFLPPETADAHTDWIFFGAPGPGAAMHQDQISEPSWQAQIRGRKRWRLEPPGECSYQCQPLEVVVEPGDIIVLDTFLWFHATEVLGSETSITIGAEYGGEAEADRWDKPGS